MQKDIKEGKSLKFSDIKGMIKNDIGYFTEVTLFLCLLFLSNEKELHLCRDPSNSQDENDFLISSHQSHVEQIQNGNVDEEMQEDDKNEDKNEDKNGSPMNE